MSYVGRYNLKNPSKYMGVGTIPIYKSKNELMAFSVLDNQSKIIRWGYEIIEIPYRNPIDQKIHKYKVDIYCEIKEKNSILKCLIEIKQSTDLLAPRAPTLANQNSRRRYELAKRSFIVNTAKWNAVIAVAKKAGFKFMFFTEKNLEGLL